MTTKWPAYWLTYVLLVSAAFLASPICARSGSPRPEVRVDAQVTAQAVRIDTTAAEPFAYAVSRPTANLVVVDLVGVASTAPSTPQILDSSVVSSYRVLPLRAGETQGVRLEVVLRTPVEPRFERRGPGQLTLVFAAQPAPVAKSARTPAPAPSASATSAATTIASVEVARTGSATDVRIAGNGHLTYQATRLSKPDRLALDFSGVHLARARAPIAGQATPVRAVRLGQFKPNVARLVIDLERAAPYSIKTEQNSVVVEFAAATAAAPSAPAVLTTAVQPGKIPAVPRLGETPQPASMQPVIVEVAALPLPESLTSQTTALAAPAPQGEPAAPVAAAPAAATGPATVAAKASAPVSAPQNPPAAAPAPQRKYTGEPISVNLKDVDLKDFFRLIHEISGLNVVLDPSVKGTLTIVLDDVPWDQALDIVLHNNNLDKQLEGNVLRVATQETLKKEAEVKRDLAKAEAEAVDQVTTTRVLSYAKASALRDTLKRFLSSRGEILADDRSNTLIIRDIPSVLPELDNLIRQLDRKGQQVEIEARVVAASRSFAEDIGTQFGFATTTTGGRTLFGGLAGAAGFTSPIATGTSLPLPPLVTSGSTSLPLNTNLGASTPTSGVTFAHRSPNLALDFILSAAENKGVGKLLSKPKVITQNNEKAIVKQGTKIPIQTTINNTISVQFIDAVLKLEVTPQITADGTVFMQVMVENTQIDNGILRVNGIPALDTQAIDAHVLINDGGTVVIGGIIISSQNTSINQVPLFGSIPVIGHLFKRTTIKVDSQELLFFLTPRVVPS